MMKSLSEAKLKYVRFRFCPVFYGLFYGFVYNFIVRFKYEDDVSPTWFFSGNLYNFVFSNKKNSNSKNFAHLGFYDPEVWTKLLDFAAGMDFDTTIISIWLQLSHYGSW